MADLIVYLPAHGYSDDDTIYVSWLDSNYFVASKDTNSFKISSTAGGGNLVQSSGTITDGFVRQVNNTGITAITGLEHLEGETVKLTSNGALVTTATVSSGSITATASVETYAVGIGYEATLKPMDLDLQGTGLATTKRINRAIINLHETIGGKIGPDANNLEDIPTGSSLFTGHKEISNPGGYTRDTDITIKQVDPLPMTVLSLTYDVGGSND
jgi:hypothetical protein